jgi:hypothetical protein
MTYYRTREFATAPVQFLHETSPSHARIPTEQDGPAVQQCSSDWTRSEAAPTRCVRLGYRDQPLRRALARSICQAVIVVRSNLTRIESLETKTRPISLKDTSLLASATAGRVGPMPGDAWSRCWLRVRAIWRARLRREARNAALSRNEADLTFAADYSGNRLKLTRRKLEISAAPRAEF